MDPDSLPAMRLKRGAYIFYCVSLAIIITLTVLGIIFGDFGESLVGVPMIIVLGMAVMTDRRSIHIPPIMVIMVIAAFFLGIGGRLTSVNNDILAFIASMVTGINLGLLGLILIYILLKSMPGMRDENRRVAGFVATCIALSSYILVRIIQYLIQTAMGKTDLEIEALMRETIAILIGAILVSLIYDFKWSHNIFGGILNTFLEENSGVIGMDDMQRTDILRLIEDGESEWLEFKSTLRTNLQTGEVDKRMEKAVLKTIVAFLNSEGGNLLIGVADDGIIIGSDVESFENKDKMGLHLSNLISSQIGASFLPCISFFMVDFDDKTVIRVKCDPCKKPVFLKDGKTEIFYVRKGPQSEELAGMTLINYVNNRRIVKGKGL